MPFRYDLNPIPYDYSVEMTNRFKGLDLVETMPEELWMEVHNTAQEVVTKTILRKRNARRHSGCLRRPYKQLRKEEKQKAKEKGIDTSNWMQSPENSKKRKESLLKWTMQRNKKKKNRIRKTRNLFKKIRDSKGMFHAKWAQ